MSTNGEKCSGTNSICNLALDAYQEIEQCCETLCHKETVMNYISALENEIIKLNEELSNGK